MDAGLDMGMPIEEKAIPIENSDTIRTLFDRSRDESIEMMYQALKKVSDTNFVPEKIDQFGDVYTMPNLREWSTLQLRLLWRRWFAQ